MCTCMKLRSILDKKLTDLGDGWMRINYLYLSEDTEWLFYWKCHSRVSWEKIGFLPGWLIYLFNEIRVSLHHVQVCHSELSPVHSTLTAPVSPFWNQILKKQILLPSSLPPSLSSFLHLFLPHCRSFRRAMSFAHNQYLSLLLPFTLSISS